MAACQQWLPMATTDTAAVQEPANPVETTNTNPTDQPTRDAHTNHWPARLSLPEPLRWGRTTRVPRASPLAGSPVSGPGQHSTWPAY